MPILNEFEGNVGTEFFPYDDASEENRYLALIVSDQSGSGMDTLAINNWRQGVELTLPKYVYGSTQPKIWAGNIKHFEKIVTYGQARSWTEFENTASFDDQPISFNPTQYITDPANYPVPILFNDGPQQEEETIIEPFTIPFRKLMIEGAKPFRTVRGNLEDGNKLDGEEGNTRILQFQEYASPLTARYFLDSGQEYVGSGPVVDDIIYEGYVPLITRVGAPFNDTSDEEIVKQVEVGTGGDSATFLGELKKLEIELDDELRGTYIDRSMSAGYSVYGPEQNRYNTDSIVFLNLIRGS